MAKDTVIGVDVGGTKIAVGKLADNQIIEAIKRDITAEGKVQQTADEIIAAIEYVNDDSVTGIGVGVPSLLDLKRGTVYN